MNVLHVVAYFVPAYCYGGPPRSVLALCQALQSEGVDVAVLTSSANGENELPDSIIQCESVDGIPVKYVHRSFPKSLFYSKEQLPWLYVHLADYDIVHIHGCWNLFVWQVGYVCRKMKIPYIISPRGMLEAEAMKFSAVKKRFAYAMIERRQIKQASLLHATSVNELTSINSLNLNVPVAVLPNIIEFPQGVASKGCLLRLMLDIAEDDFVVLFVGRIHPIKGLEVLCAAIRQLKQSSSDIRLVLVGDGEVEYVSKLKSEFSDLIGSNNLYFTGHLEGVEKADAYLSANTFALMSQSENFGLAAAEAMSYGLPVILSKGCPWPQIENWQAGYWVEASTPMVADAIQKLSQNRSMAIAMGEHAKENIFTYLDWKLIANKMKLVYTGILSNNQF